MEEIISQPKNLRLRRSWQWRQSWTAFAKHVPEEDDKNCLDGKSLWFRKSFSNGKNLISQKICQIWREIHVTKCGKISFPRTYWSTLFFKPTFIAIEIEILHILWHRIKKCGHFWKWSCLLATIAYRKNITSGQSSLIWELQQCIVQSVETDITKSKGIDILLRTKGSQKEIKWAKYLLCIICWIAIWFSWVFFMSYWM